MTHAREDGSNEHATATHYVYWIPPDEFEYARSRLAHRGYRVRPARLTPCQVLKAEGRTVVYATPERWNGLCNRQGSWYRASPRRGQYMLVADHELPFAFAEYLDARLGASSFTPAELPTEAQLREVVGSKPYRKARPRGWERLTWRDSAFLKVFFRLLRFWGSGEGLATHWLGHRANHANFLARRFTTRLDGEDVAYSVTGNAGVCSSCVQFFNIMAPEARKLVRACPGSITFAGAERDVYYDVRPVPITVGGSSPDAGPGTLSPTGDGGR